MKAYEAFVTHEPLDALKKACDAGINTSGVRIVATSEVPNSDLTTYTVAYYPPLDADGPTEWKEP